MKTVLFLAALAALHAAAAARAQERVHLPLLVPITGALALEGQSERDGALLALDPPAAAGDAARPLRPSHAVFDTGSNPQVAVQAFERAMAAEIRPRAMLGPIDGNSMLALLPLAEREKVALLSVSGTARLTELGNAYIFRFFPSDVVVKAAQARYAVEELQRRKIALVYQNTAYGQSGNEQLGRWIESLGAAVVYRNSVPVTTKELSGVIAQVRDSGADAVLLQLHSGSSALFLKQAARAGLALPIVGGSALHQPSTAALLEPAELKGVCAETASAPAADPGLAGFARTFRERMKSEPDAFALAAFDAVNAALAAARMPGPLAENLAKLRHAGLAMTYESDGKGNMAHDAIIVCYDGTSRTPRIAKRYARPHEAARR
ncbi:MAG: ABC transporter substrate-binding protein [Candidatus Odyssella sp.]|nr:ABC transporter substrate-binding protein [Candidatus Odyssella sp.]